MPLETDADLATFFNANEFGTVATWRAGGTGAAKRVVGILIDDYVGPALGQLSAESREILFRCRTSDVAGAAQGDTLEFAGAVHRVRSARAGHDATTTLVLAA